MSNSGRDVRELSDLFKREDKKLVNIKFFRGTDEFISDDSLRSEFTSSIHRAEEAQKAGVKSAPPMTRQTEKLDLRKIVADIG